MFSRSRCHVVLCSRWRASQAFSGILRRSQSFPVNRAPQPLAPQPRAPQPRAPPTTRAPPSPLCLPEQPNARTSERPVRPFARSLVRPFARSPVRSFARSFVRLFARSPVRSFAHPYTKKVKNLTKTLDNALLMLYICTINEGVSAHILPRGASGSVYTTNLNTNIADSLYQYYVDIYNLLNTNLL